MPTVAGWRRWAWLGATGVAAGSAIWTTHFVAMIAYRAGLPTGYAAPATIASLAVAIVGSGVGFGLASATRNPLNRFERALAGGMVVGCAVGAMHYTGMLGFRTAGTVTWDSAYVFASALVGTLLSGLALVLVQPGAGDLRAVAAGLVLSGAIVAMHFIGMAAMTITPDPRVTVPDSLWSHQTLAAAAVAVTILILSAVTLGAMLASAGRARSLSRLRDALNAMPEGLAYYDAADRLAAWNVQYAELLGPLGVQLFEGVTFEEVLRAIAASGQVPAAVGREREWLEQRYAVRWSRTPAVVINTADDRAIRISERRTRDGGTILVAVDITELKAAEAELRRARDHAEEQARRAEFAEAMARLGHWRIDGAGRAITWSASMYAICGFPTEAVLDLAKVLEIVHPDDLAEIRAMVARQVGGGAGPEDFLVRIVRPDGDLRWLKGQCCGERGSDGETVGVVGTAIDITEQHLLEEELRKARSEAEAAAAVKSEFLANMSHELRTPLNSIIGFTGLMAAGDLSPAMRTHVERVAAASRALLFTVNDILDFSKLEAGQVVFRPEPVAPARLGRSTLDLFMPQAQAKGLALAFEGEGGALASVDPDRLRQILLNLVGNAVKFTQAGEVRLEVSYDAAAGMLSAAVTDTGPGVPEDKRHRLFQRFSQVDGSFTRAQGGTGLGLAICKGLVEAMGGEIGVESRPGEGSRFWFRIPAPPAIAPAARSDEARALAPRLAGLKVLLAEDHPANRELARLFLTGAGAEVVEACDGQDAAEQAEEGVFDVILLDVQMPRLDGPAALARIRGGGVNGATPAVAFTADADPERARRLLEAGFQAVASKPIDPPRLLAAVERAAAGRPADDGSIARVA